MNEDPASDTVPPEGTRLVVSHLPPSYFTKEAVYDLFKPFGSICRIALGREIGTAQVTYFQSQSSKIALEKLNNTELDGFLISVHSANANDARDTVNSVIPDIYTGAGRGAFSAGSNSDGTPTTEYGPKKQYSYASGHRATCGIGPRPYGLSATAEPFDPSKRSQKSDQPATAKSPTQRSASSPLSSTGLLEISPGVPLVVRSSLQPVPLYRLIIQNVPLELKAATLYMALRNTFNKYESPRSSTNISAPASPTVPNSKETTSTIEGSDIKIMEVSLAIDESTDQSLGIAVIKLEDREQFLLALKILNGNYLDGYGEEDEEGGESRMPLRVKKFEPRGYIEKGLHLQDQKVPTGVESVNETNQMNGQIPAHVTGQSEETASVFPSIGSSSAAPSVTSSNNGSLINKHRKLLATALDDLDINVSKSLFRSEHEKQKLIELLVSKLSDEERKKCIFEEEHLVEMCKELKGLYWNDNADNDEMARMDDSGTGEEVQDRSEIRREGSESPTRVYGRKELLGLYTPHSPTHEKTEAMMRAISPTTFTVPLPTSPTVLSKAAARGDKSQDMTMDELVKLSIKDIIKLASEPKPPTLLAKRDEEIVKSVEAFMKGIEGLKVTQQKQKIGEKVFKVLKSKVAGMKNMSKRTVTLLDTEDLAALMHLTEEYPDVLVAKATTLSTL
ncbi:hypothetical protein P389DRAFT_33043 [Cystobasidium minutum MCA 4210]|uniref:uncharacterized protein n=1 Tax=Cystobasidium minutum MCA 4210 TaxID=1397322 RepID=UPI0034CF14A2|eukprot:jgi/Rhomi1/33043/CE33042_227